VRIAERALDEEPPVVHADCRGRDGASHSAGASAADGEQAMHVFRLEAEQVFDPKRHVEKILGTVGEGDVTVACWEPGQTSPYHCHPLATEIYFCFAGGGTMRTPEATVEIVPGSFVVHPRGELHEYVNGPARTLLFRVRYGEDMAARIREWPSNPAWRAAAADREYFASRPAR
jgi:quercetin dioxygenase-like cupin family protein